MRRLPGKEHRRAALVPWLAAATAAALLFLAVPRSPEPPGVLTARGAAATAHELELLVRLHPQGAARATRTLQDGDDLAPEDGLSFTIANRGPEELFVAIFAVDAAGEVHWFYPARVRPQDDPSSVPLPADSSPFTLPEGVVPEMPARGDFVVTGVFTPIPLSTSRIESAVAKGGIAGLEALAPLAMPTLHLTMAAPESAR